MSSDSLEPGSPENGRHRREPRRSRAWPRTVMLLRGGADRLEVLLAKRTPAARFMGGAWVFPGGSVSAEDGEGTAGLRAAAVRELAEEVGVELPADAELVAFSTGSLPTRAGSALTPGSSWRSRRRAPSRTSTALRSSMLAGLSPRWRSPPPSADEIMLVFPTIKHLEQISRFASMDTLLDYARRPDRAPGAAARRRPWERREGADRPARGARIRRLIRMANSDSPRSRFTPRTG